MGVLTDCFRAPDAEAVVRALAAADGSSAVVRADLDVVEAKRIGPGVVLRSGAGRIRRISPHWPGS